MEKRGIIIATGGVAVVAILARQIITQGTAMLQIEPTPDCSIYLNDILRGQSPQNITVSPGTYKVTLEQDGYYDYTVTVTVAANDNVVIAPQLQPEGTTPGERIALPVVWT